MSHCSCDMGNRRSSTLDNHNGWANSAAEALTDTSSTYRAMPSIQKPNVHS